MDNRKFLFILVLFSLIVLPDMVSACALRRSLVTGFDVPWGCSSDGICCTGGTCEDSCCEYDWWDFTFGFDCVCGAHSSNEFCSDLGLESYTYEGYGMCQKDVTWEYLANRYCPTTDQSIDGTAGIIRWEYDCSGKIEGRWDASEDLVVECDDDEHHTQIKKYWCNGPGDPIIEEEVECESGCDADIVCDEAAPDECSTGCSEGNRYRLDCCDEDCHFKEGTCEYSCGAHLACDGRLPGDCIGGCSYGNDYMDDCCDNACAIVDNVCQESCGAKAECDGLKPFDDCGFNGQCTSECACEESCLPDGCNGICPPQCTVLDDTDCGCTHDNGCCGKDSFDQPCTVEDDNDCCDGDCPSGFDVFTDYDCGCYDVENDCCPEGCTDDPGDVHWPNPDYDADCEICNYFDPSIILSTSDECIAETTLEYNVRISNNYNGYSCEDTVFILECDCPDGWACTLEVDSNTWECASETGETTIAAGWFKNGKLYVTPPALEPEGEYTVSVTASNVTEEGTYEATEEAICSYGITCETEDLGILPEDSCNNDCPPGCTYDQDWDCGCGRRDSCCGPTCNTRNDRDCPECSDSDRGIYPLRAGICIDETKTCDGKGCADECGGPLGFEEYYCNATTHKCEIADFDCDDYSRRWCGFESGYARICSYNDPYSCWCPGSIFSGFDCREGYICRSTNWWGTFGSCKTCNPSAICDRWTCPYEDYTLACVPLLMSELAPETALWGWLGTDEDGNLPYRKETAATDPSSYGCENEIDDDCDELIDCEDPDCRQYCEPLTTILCNAEECKNDCWYDSDVEISLFCQGGKAPCDKTYYCIDRTDSCVPRRNEDFEYTEPFTLSNEINYVRFFSTDTDGNIETLQSQQIKIRAKTVLEPTITVLNLGSERRDIDLSLESINPGTSRIQVSFNPNPIPAGQFHSTMSITILEGTPTGIYTLTIEGVSDRGTPQELRRTTSYKLTVV